MQNTTSPQTSTPTATPSAQTPTPVIPPALNLAVTLTPAMINRSVINKPVALINTRILNPNSGFKKKVLCSGPTFSAGTACFFNCRYCYVKDLMNKASDVHDILDQYDTTFQDIAIRRSNAVVRLGQELRSAKGVLKYKGGKYAAARLAGNPYVIYGSPLVDIAATVELMKETIQIVKLLLDDTDFDIRLLSKSPLIVAVAKSLSPDQKSRVIFGLSTGTMDDALALAIEPTCKTPTQRIKALHWLQNNGHRTFAMICPILPQPLTQFVQQAVAAVRPHLCEHVWAEVFNARGDSTKQTRDALTDAGQTQAAADLSAVFGEGSKARWEQYARNTFLALAAVIPKDANGNPKLRFLQYVTKPTEAWWQTQVPNGAIVLKKKPKVPKAPPGLPPSPISGGATIQAVQAPVPTTPLVTTPTTTSLMIGTTQNQLTLAHDTPPVSLASTSVITPVTPQAKVKDPKWIEAGKKAWTTRLANRAAQNGQPVQPKVKNPKRIEAGMKAWATRVTASLTVTIFLSW